MPPPIPEDAKKKGSDEKTVELQDGDLLPADSESKEDNNVTVELSTRDLLPPDDSGKGLGEDEIGLATEASQATLKETPLATVLQQDEHVRTLHEVAATQILSAEPQAEIGTRKFVVIGNERMPVSGSKSESEKPIAVVESEMESGERRGINLKLAAVAAEYGRLKGNDLATNADFLREMESIAEDVERNPASLNQLRGLIKSRSITKGGKLPVMSESERAVFAELGTKLFERNSRAFAKEFGAGHQLFSPRARRIEIATRLALESKKGAAEEAEEMLVNRAILPDEVLGILHRLEGEEAAKLEQKIAEAEVGPLVEARKRLEMLKNFETSRDNLSAAIQQELPELAAADQARREIERELKKKDVRVTTIGTGVTAPLYSEGASGMGSVYKPALHETGNENGDGSGGPHMRLSLRKDETMYAEVMAGTIALLTGMKRMPETVLANGPVGIGTKQKWTEGKSAARSFSAWAEPDGIKERYRFDFEDIVALDILINNSDRHLNNILVGEGATPIDHGLSQVDNTMDPMEALPDVCAERGLDPENLSPTERAECLNEIISRSFNDEVCSSPQHFLQDKPMNPELLNRLMRLKETLDRGGEVEMALTDQFRLFYGDEKGVRLTKLFRERLDDLVKAEKFPKTSVLFNTVRKKALLEKIAKLQAN